MTSRAMSQQEIDDFFNKSGNSQASSGEVNVTDCDLRRLDRIPKTQLSIIHFLHETFVRSLASSLTVYLRSYVAGALISVEQLPFAEFTDALQSPTCLVYFTLLPYKGYCLVEVNHALLAPILDYVMGGNGIIKHELNREITDLEESMLDNFFEIIASDLTKAWGNLTRIDFAIEAIERKTQLSQRITRNESVVAIAIELQIGEVSGMINVAIPSITLKMMKESFDRKWTIPTSGSVTSEEKNAVELAKRLNVDLELCLLGSTISMRDLLNIKPGDILDLNLPVTSKGVVLVNGRPKLQGSFVQLNEHPALVVEASVSADS